MSVEFYFHGGEWTEYVALYSMAGEDYLYPSIFEFGMWPESCPCYEQVGKYSLL